MCGYQILSLKSLKEVDTITLLPQYDLTTAYISHVTNFKVCKLQL